MICLCLNIWYLWCQVYRKGKHFFILLKLKKIPFSDLNGWNNIWRCVHNLFSWYQAEKILFLVICEAENKIIFGTCEKLLCDCQLWILQIYCSELYCAAFHGIVCYTVHIPLRGCKIMVFVSTLVISDK